MDASAPTTLDEALEIRASHPEAVPIAGGTDLMVEVNARRLRPAAFLDLSRADAPEPSSPIDVKGILASTACRAPVPDVPSQQAVPEHLGLGLGQQELMKAR